METEYGQNRKYFHNVRFSPEEEKIIRERMEKYNYTRVSDFIRDAVLDDQIKVVTVVHQDPIRKDYTVLIKSTVECIRVLEARMTRAQKDFQEALKHPGTDPELINRHATRFRLITATLANRMNELITSLGEGHEQENCKLRPETD